MALSPIKGEWKLIVGAIFIPFLKNRKEQEII
jgi:hypothetical protein